MNKKSGKTKKKIKKLKINKKLLALLCTGVLVGGGVGFLKLAKGKKEKEHVRSSIENTLGYDDINSFYNCSVFDDNFVILNVGDHNSFGEFRKNKKMEICNKNGISLGIVIDSSASSEADIYKDFEIAKGIVHDYKVDLPVYLNIDSIINDTSLNSQMKERLIRDFLTKCEANGIYVGLTGLDSSLCKVQSIMDISNYDCYVVKEEENIKYSGTYHLYKDLDGSIRSNCNLSEYINLNGLNKKSSLVNDFKYIVNSNDELEEISLETGISVKDLRNYNNLVLPWISKGTIIKVPCYFTERVQSKSTYEKVALDEAKRGCDISYCQDSLDWNQVKKNFEFVILRTNIGETVDNLYSSHSENCERFDIPMGAYCFNAYWKYNCNYQDFIDNESKQADKTIELLDGKNVTFPVFFDIELSGEKIREYPSLSEALPKEYVSTMLDIWYEKVSSAGYIPGIYVNKTFYDYLSSCVDYKLNDRFEIWFAGGPNYGSSNIDINDAQPYNTAFTSYGADINQPCACINAGEVGGLVDVNFSRVNYKKVNQNTTSIDAEEPEITDYIVRHDGVLGAAYGTAIGAGVIGCYGVVHRKNKKKSKTKSKANK